MGVLSWKLVALDGAGTLLEFYKGSQVMYSAVWMYQITDAYQFHISQLFASVHIQVLHCRSILKTIANKVSINGGA